MSALSTVAGGDLDAVAWDGWIEVSLGLSIRRLLALSPPPEDSLIAPDLEVWASRLLSHGQARMAAAGQPHLSLVSSDRGAHDE